MKVGDKVRVKDQLHLGVWRCQVGQISSVSGEIYYVDFSNGKKCACFKDDLAFITDENPPPPYILIPVGEYDGSDLPDTEIDEHYTVWSVLPNPEAECIIIE